jgi:hypothetical protein
LKSVFLKLIAIATLNDRMIANVISGFISHPDAAPYVQLVQTAHLLGKEKRLRELHVVIAQLAVFMESPLGPGYRCSPHPPTWISVFLDFSFQWVWL